ncbi:MAG: hypothetical protein WHU10_11125 [Fimbriimonadales bacterium]
MGRGDDNSGCGCCLVLYILAAFSFPILWIPLILALALLVRDWIVGASASSGTREEAEEMATRPRQTRRRNGAPSAAVVQVPAEPTEDARTDPLTGEEIPPWAEYAECAACGVRYTPDSYRHILQNLQGRCQVCRKTPGFRVHAATGWPDQPNAGRPTVTWLEEHALTTMTQPGRPSGPPRLTPAEARQILGLPPSPTGAQIRSAYATRIRRLLDLDPIESRQETQAQIRLLDAAFHVLLREEGSL